MADAFIYDAIRTPRGKGKQGGSLYEVKPIDLVTNLLEAMKERLDLDTTQVEDLILACGEPVKEQGQNIAKAALVYSSWDDITTGAQLHRFCAGGLDAVNMAAAKVAAGFEDMVAAGGVESMSRLGIGASGGATGDPWVAMKSYFISQGLGADIIATQDGITREEVDAYALRSQQRAAHARDNGYFKSLVPVRDMNGVAILDHDEFIRADTSAEGLAKLKPAFQMFNDFGHGGVAKLRYPDLENINCVHTPGNSSGIVDGAGLVLIGNESAGKAQGLKPRARIVSCALVGSEPTIMLDGPVPATQKALKKAGMTLDDIDLFELNEAFASVVLRYQRRLSIPDDKLNVNGGAIAMGHPIGATGAMILGTVLDELERRDLQRGLVTLCAGGGIGIATIIERV
ncbi:MULTISPECIES: acetyl-CoA C-acetyltransferase [Spongiibacter]|uniref:acetyl-CoA C-acetyltransferase n=3 Tax=Spongiibacteraceae TaxID=1706375 RepID=UPI000C671E74|nr:MULTISPECIES: acetyl-CoA C-acetyltransferase [Spongiibacter]MAY37202.1 acetyl-CoA acetyltransferase [Spongiibacter sp.]MBI58654.1 acetyl-CoA acetyltransferase [Spongiibacter sp.]MBO6752106.1 acetyl-CoA C-acetyltransferase [Spongiibacter sp.]MBU70605.1 acetyl-CoA acetyltransferase [Spongiibacter sp.]|tara:strand:- start:35188 stop:36387 length:1200 start_codon:yes stop_codon:yes gene_type:complete